MNSFDNRWQKSIADTRENISLAPHFVECNTVLAVKILMCICYSNQKVIQFDCNKGTEGGIQLQLTLPIKKKNRTYVLTEFLEPTLRFQQIFWNKLTKNSWIWNGSKSVRRFHALRHFCWLYFWLIITKLASKSMKLTRIIEIIIEINLSSFWQSYWKKFVQAPRAPPWLTFKCKIFQYPIRF